MIEILKTILLEFFSILPDSPFQLALAGMDLSFMPAVNWFVPFDTCADLTLAWLSCIGLYFIFMLAAGLIKKIISSKIMKAVIAAFMAGA